MLTWVARYTFGSATLRGHGPSRRAADARRDVIAARAAAAGIVQAASPAGGSSASMASLPPLYGSQTAVQPPAWTARNSPPVMNCAVTPWPAAVVNGPGLVKLTSNGVAHAACR